MNFLNTISAIEAARTSEVVKIVAENDAKTYVKSDTGSIYSVANIINAKNAGVIELNEEGFTKPKFGTFNDNGVTVIRLKEQPKRDTGF
jgi:hypothetical protein